MQRRAALRCFMTHAIQYDNIPSIPSRNGGGYGGAALKARMEIAVCNRHKFPPPPSPHPPQPPAGNLTNRKYFRGFTRLRFMLTASGGGVCMAVEIQW